jgi:hypothetical protein
LWIFYAADATRVAVHITVVSITGRVNQQMQYNEDEYTILYIYIGNLAKGKPINRHQEKGKMETQ